MAEAEGIPPTASTASVGLGIRYIGQQHCYAFSGLIPATNVAKPALDFLSGSGYIVGELQLNAAVNNTTGAMNGTFSVITFNGINIAILITASSANDSPGSVTQPLIIPPFTHVEATIDNEGTDTDQNGSITFTGRVYDV